MDRIKVIIVDDEVLAIRHIKQMIDWEALGFEVVAESTFPEKALELVLRHQPHIAFVDIRMPVLDGLAFSRQALEIARELKIVLLTAYKEFEYAKEAVKIGVYDYLVKHELKADQLEKEMLKIKSDLEREQKRDLWVRRQLFVDLLSGRDLPSDQIALLKSAERPYRYEFIMVQRDQPFPVLTLPSEQSPPASPLPSPVPPNMESDSYYVLETLPIRDGRWGVVLGAAVRLQSERQRMDRLLAVAGAMRRYCKEQHGTNVTLAASRSFEELNKLASAYRETERAIQASVFLRSSTLLMPEDVDSDAKEPPLQMVPAAEVAAVAETLATGDADGLRTAIIAAFESATKRRRPERLRAVCDELTETLERYRKSRSLQRFDLWVAEEGRSDPSRWHHVDSIRDWFIGVFMETLREAENAANAGYSRKIRHTLEYMHAHYAEELTAEYLAERVGVSGDRLRHLFKEETGFTILEYMTRIRIGHAKQLLETGNYKIYEIALKTGYKSSQYFSQVFRKMTGVNPLEYAEGKGAGSVDQD
ncbi:helix-turn-helix domain-containing protein [Paenibacillus allorhizosphaerae]|uniref:HTH-type transcriptional activator RhaR n=1 Tax=Paenibacillus allorhizosphaerae TaxID=2849866 RepID=A0ABM8VAI5_9BACL|nr:helix-turn-helix domain-containing protein [Paenibacillus allorhizosphaerae]CAG7616644.1 HTH-type transcriptional activator RhaR [Paenibacillus allorhizosphaerae]